MTFTLTGAPYRKACISFLVYLRIGLSGSTKPDWAYTWTVHWLSDFQPGIVNAPSESDLESSYSWVRSMSETEPRPSQRVHMPPVRLKVAFTVCLAPRSTVIAPLARTEGTLNA